MFGRQSADGVERCHVVFVRRDLGGLDQRFARTRSIGGDFSSV
jgi:hypothetical protein